MKHQNITPDADGPAKAAAAEATVGKIIPGPGGPPAADRREGEGAKRSLVTDILNIMEQGILFWSPEGVCELHNSRIFQVLELNAADLSIGSTATEFAERSLARGEISEEVQAHADQQIGAHMPYSFDRKLPSGRVVFTNGRPTRGGGYVVTFTDVTEARRAAQDLARAKAEAEAAQSKAVELLRQERDRQAEAKHLSQLDEWLQSCKSLRELYDIVTHFMGQLLPASKGELYIFSSARDVLEGVCRWGTEDLHRAIETDSCWALRRGRSYEFTTEGLCFLCEHVEDHHHEVAVEEYICLPIVAHGDTVGMLHIRFDPSAKGAAKIGESGPFAVRCAEHISMAIANVRLRDELHERSIRDTLTGLYNRRYFMDALRRNVMRFEDGKGSLGVISFDADLFKSFNDTFGHEAGDVVLREIAERVTREIGPENIACRVGGEEFVVLMPGTTLEEAGNMGERIRRAVSSGRLRYRDQVLPEITISIGVSAYPETTRNQQELLQQADEALYRAKAEGRNCVRLAEPR